MGNKFSLYLAGPLFTQAERIWNSNLSHELGGLIPDARIILPQADAVKFIKESGVDFGGLVKSCIHSIDHSDVVLAILDGSDADSGTCWECGYAYAKGKRVIGVRTDWRGSEDEGLNAMLRRTCEKVIYYPAVREDICGLAKEITSAILGNTRK